ncbi:hypothetical protein PIB30_017144 [Stylosanthes scabra]|uniref:Uncharacterized protein n=1 Tax=Stylosanthes scabra TaxID=79078 RepID=A0ABU6V968_9FABA|nr:hypothetical protein [Stylosanthes scabra]
MANHASSSAIITIVIKPHSWPFLATEYVITPFDQSIDIDALTFKLLRAIPRNLGSYMLSDLYRISIGQSFSLIMGGSVLLLPYCCRLDLPWFIFSLQSTTICLVRLLTKLVYKSPNSYFIHLFPSNLCRPAEIGVTL